MIFADVPVKDAEGCILAHSVAHGSGVLKKGRVLSAADVALLQAANIGAVTAVRLEADDVAEDEAARLIAESLCGAGLVQQAPFTGRVNAHAQAAGVCLVDAERVRAINRVHESITLATVPPFARLAERQMAATIKIIPYAVKRAVLEQVLAAAAGGPVITVAAFQPQEVGLVITEVAGGKASLVAKAEEAMRVRIEATGSRLAHVIRTPHRKDAVAAALQELKGKGCSPILLFGASAIVDRGDVLPAALVEAGGEVKHLGMPVDPGNLLMLGKWDGLDVIGVPSCARSPKVNGFDWVLERLLAGLTVTPLDIMEMGAGGLLAEIPTRPLPREGRSAPQRAPKVAAVVLAAGLSSRMGYNKLLAQAGGKPLLSHVLATLRQAALEDIVVVTGHDAEEVSKAVAGARIVHNADYAIGLSTSLRAGLSALPADIDAAFICLADMPLVDAATLNRLVAAFNPAEHRSICIPTFEGRRGNPVLWGRQQFAALMAVTGDQGGRALIEEQADEVAEVAVASDGVLRDADTPEALAAIRAAVEQSS